MEEIIYLIFLLVGYYLGLSNKNSEKTNKPINLAKINPLTSYQEHKSKKEQEQNQKELEIMLQNIENYDGTGNHQIDVK